AGTLYLAVAVNALASLLVLATLLSYLFFYTPLKRRTPLCVLIGAFPGAMPPLIGWAGASGKLGFRALIPYAVLFLWQFPHFMAIAWMYREDYARARYLVLPHHEPAKSRAVDWQTLLPLSALVLLCLWPAFESHPSTLYGIAASLLSLGFFYYGVQFVVRKSNAAARRLLAASIIYLPCLFVLMMFSRG